MSGARMDRIVAAARDLVGVRFRLQGRSRASGVDCVGLAALALAGCSGGGRAAHPVATVDEGAHLEEPGVTPALRCVV